MLGRPPVPRQALVAAALGAIFGLLWMNLPGGREILGLNVEGIAWFVLSLSLLFVVPIAYHVYTFWAILWVVYRGVAAFRAPEGANVPALILDLLLPVASLVLLFTSHYMEAARPPADAS